MAFATLGQTYDAKTDFSFTQNPNGAWSYGWSATLGGQLHLYGSPVLTSGFELWQDPTITSLNDPNLGYNPRDTQFQYFPPQSMIMHPGPQNQFSNCVWTAPAAGVYNIQAVFTAIWTGGPHGYLLKNGVAVNDGALTQDNPWSVTLSSVSLAAGDTIDAAVGVGASGVFFNDNTDFSLTITRVNSASGGVSPGIYRALITGTSGTGVPAGALNATVRKGGSFSGTLYWAGTRIPLKGKFDTNGAYSTVLKLKDGASLAISLGFDPQGNLTGTVTIDGETYALNGGSISKARGMAGSYTFTISPGVALESGTAPAGIGFGYMDVLPTGAVSLVGELPDGKSFATSSWITSGSSVPIYAPLYQSAGGGMEGTLVFRNVPDVSDCDGTLVWTSPSNKSHSPYAGGFELSAQFQATRFNANIAGLNHDSVSFNATGGDLQANFLQDITVTPIASVIPIFGGNASQIHLSIAPMADVFFGSFEDATTHSMRSFTGILRPKSRTGAGLFLSDGLSGSVDIEY
jgi:hypothetical protein